MLLIIPIQPQQQPGTCAAAFFGLKNAGCRWISVALAGMKKGAEAPIFKDLQTSVEVCRSYIGAGNETRTRDPDLGKVVLYQLSYSRIVLMTGAILAVQIAASSL
jgi:hypothetical protein